MRDDLKSIQRDMEEHNASSSGFFATLKTQLQQNSSTVESAILAGFDGLAQQNLALMNAFESSQTRAMILVSSGLSKDPNPLLLTDLQENDVKSIQLSLIQKPSLFKKTYDEFKSREFKDMETSAAYGTVTSPSRIRKTRTGMVCTCRLQTSSQQYSSSQNGNSRKTLLTVSLHSANTNHHRGCPHSSLVESSWSLKFRLAYCSRLLARAVQTSISLTKGAGGTSLSPNMTFRCLVADDSPAFALMRDPWTWNKSVNDIETVVNQRVQSLRQMFQDRKASPYDIDMYGNTLLHVGNPM